MRRRRRTAGSQGTSVPPVHDDDDSCCVSLKDGVKNVFEDVAEAIESAPDTLFDALPPTEVEVVFQMRAIEADEGSDGVEIGIDLGFLSFDVDTKGDKTIRKREVANTIKFKFACKKKTQPPQPTESEASEELSA